jgi:hypothetical protein
MQINNKATIETSNNPDSTFDVIKDPTKLHRRMLENGDRYTNNGTIEVNSKKFKIGKNPIPLKTVMNEQKNHPE